MRPPTTALDGENPTLAEILRDAGYWTIGFSARGLMSAQYGLNRGFQWWTEYVRANSSDMLPGLFDALGTMPQQPLFLFFHTYDVHGPYDSLPGTLSPSTTDSPRTIPPSEWARITNIRYHRYLLLNRFSSLPSVVDSYDRGIRFVDQQLGLLVERLQSLGLYDEFMIIVTSDHGETLYDRDLYIGHSYSLHDEELHVPFILKLPGSERTGIVDELASQVDIVPLLLALTEIEQPAEFSGVVPKALGGTAPEDRWIRGESSHVGAKFGRTSRWKYIGLPFSRGHSRRQVPRGLDDRFVESELTFDLWSDPGELKPLSNSEVSSIPAVDFVTSGLDLVASPGSSAQEKLSAEAEQELRALGYIE